MKNNVRIKKKSFLYAIAWCRENISMTAHAVRVDEVWEPIDKGWTFDYFVGGAEGWYYVFEFSDDRIAVEFKLRFG